MRILDLEDKQILELIDARKAQTDTLWKKISDVYDKNCAIYDGNPYWIQDLPDEYLKISLSRIFTNTEAVINSLINNPPKPNVLPNRNSPKAIKVAQSMEKFFTYKYNDLNVKEVLRTSLRDLYFARLLVLKPYWDKKLNDFNVKRVDPRKVRFSTKANKEADSEFAIEEIECSLWDLLSKYPAKKDAILKRSTCKSEAEAMIKNPMTKYEECWVDTALVIRFDDLVLYKGKNPYWDWDGILVTKDEMTELLDEEQDPQIRIKALMEETVKMPKEESNGEEMGMEVEKDDEEVPVQMMRRAEQEKKKEEYTAEGKEPDELPYEAYLFNHFDSPRKPYIFATVLKNEDGPVGRTSFIEEATPLAKDADNSKQQIARNQKIVNGITKVDASVMTKEKAQALRYDTGGVIWGKGVINGVQRETGAALPGFVFQNLEQSLNEIDNIMAATSAFRGEREGQETKAGRMALIEQSFLRLNEMVQVIDFVSKELFDWWFQLARVNYTERHYMKFMGAENALETIELSRDSFEKGMQVRVIPGKTLPEDRAFKYQRSQNDVANGIISPLTYLKDAGYENATEVAQEAYMFKQNPAEVLGLPAPEALGAPAAPVAPEQGMAPPMSPPPEMAQMAPSM